MGYFVQPKGKIPLTEGRIREILKQCDTNQDEFLSRKELQESFKQFGSNHPHLRAIDALIHADANLNFQIDSNEIKALVEFITKREYNYTPS